MTRREPDSRTARRLLACLQALARRFALAERADVSCCGITVAQAATLGALRESRDLRLGELSRRLGISASTLTRNLSRLRERGLVVIAADPEDRRASHVVLTDVGRVAASEVARREEAFAGSILSLIEDASADEVLVALESLLQAVRLATERCCPGAFDHLMATPEWRERRTLIHGQKAH